MGHITRPGSGMYSGLLVNLGNPDDRWGPTTNNSAWFQADAGESVAPKAGGFVQVPGLTKIPDITLPVSPELNVGICYVPSRWGAGTIGDLVGDERYRLMALVLLDDKRPPSYELTPEGVGSVPNSVFYFHGNLSRMVVSHPGMENAREADLTVKLDLGFVSGPETIEPLG